VRGYRRAADRQLRELGDLKITEHRHGNGPRYRRGRHHQHMRPPVGRLAAQRFALLDTESVLLVDHDHAQVGKLHLLFEQRMGADDDAGVA
jgi:hypothetical protein